MCGSVSAAIVSRIRVPIAPPEIETVLLLLSTAECTARLGGSQAHLVVVLALTEALQARSTAAARKRRDRYVVC